MALMACPECEGRVSDRARICPHCGFEMEEYHRQHVRIARIQAQQQARRTRVKRTLFVGVIAGVLVLCAVCGLLILWPHLFHP